MRARRFSKEEKEIVFKIKEELSWKKIDKCLKMLKENKTILDIKKEIGFSSEIINGIIQLKEKAKQYKNRKILVSML